MASSTKTTATKKTASTAKSAESKPAKAAPKKTTAAAKPAAATATKKPATPRKKAVPAGSERTAKARAPVSDDQRRHYVEVAAYFIAERNGFVPGRELADWAEAEAEIERLLAEGLLNP